MTGAIRAIAAKRLSIHAYKLNGTQECIYHVYQSMVEFHERDFESHN